MLAGHLQIDTNVKDNGHIRLRSVSNASTSSTLSVVSPGPSSSNASTSSLQLKATVASHQKVQNPTSVVPIPSSPDGDGCLSAQFVLAMHDFEPQQQNATCLSFQAGQIIRVLNRDSSGWWDGELDGRRGWFPSNYVTSDENVGLILQEELPHVTRPRLKHAHTISVSSIPDSDSSSKRSASRTDHRPLVIEALGSDITSYCPPLMISLLHSLSLLQSAVRSNRIAHFQPSAACIISCVRSILTATECLPREAPLLQRHPLLASERKAILSVLASLVVQAKKASEETSDEEGRDADTESMLRLGGQVFSQVRRFLAVAVQCGVDLPERVSSIRSDQGSRSLHRDQSQGLRDPAEAADITLTPSVDKEGVLRPLITAPPRAPSPLERKRESAIRKTAPRTKSLGDLKSERAKSQRDSDSSVVPLLPHRALLNARSKRERYTVLSRSVASRHKPAMMSVSSTSSSSSFSSTDSPNHPGIPLFPTGPTAAAAVMDALSNTHDQYLSTIAAFIGHVHSHSRSSHASSTGHMYNLVREIVDKVCQLLTIVEAIMRHPDIPVQKLGNLKSAKEGLYNVTRSLTSSVRMLTESSSSDITEESEKATLLRSATDALKAGSDCVSAVKLCLNRSLSEKAFIIQMPGGANSDSVARRRTLTKAPSMEEDEEDHTIQADTSPRTPMTIAPPRAESPDGSDGTSRSKSSAETQDTRLTSPDESESTPSLVVRREPQTRSSSPSRPSLDRTETHATAWDDSQKDPQTEAALVDELVDGNLPSVPLSDELVTARDPMGEDHALEDVIYNSEGHLMAATLDVLVEKMTPHNNLVDPAFSAVFFLTFRQFSSPTELVAAIIARYNIMPPAEFSEEGILTWQQRKGIPIRLRVSNFVKAWLELYWRPSADGVVLTELENFTRDALLHYFPGPSQRILDLISQRRDSTQNVIGPKSERARDPGMSINPPSFSPSEIPRPTMTRALLSTLRSKNFASIYITDFDPLELARQLTIRENNLYCLIQSEELLEGGQEGAKPPVNVKAVSSLSTVITGWVMESILDEQDMKKRTVLVKFFIKVADRCILLQNFSTSRSILAALDSATISRLHQTWIGVSQKHKTQLEALRRLSDHGRNYREYRNTLRNTAPPAVPFLGLYLTDITFCREGNASHKPSPLRPSKMLMNFNKYHKLARIVQDMQRFQVPYNLKEIPEVQEYLTFAFENSKHQSDLHDLYRRSLLVEPKQPADTAPSSDVQKLFNWATRSQQLQAPQTTS